MQRFVVIVGPAFRVLMHVFVTHVLVLYGMQARANNAPLRQPTSQCSPITHPAFFLFFMLFFLFFFSLRRDNLMMQTSANCRYFHDILFRLLRHECRALVGCNSNSEVGSQFVTSVHDRTRRYTVIHMSKLLLMQITLV